MIKPEICFLIKKKIKVYIPNQTSVKKTAFLRVKSAHFNALKRFPW